MWSTGINRNIVECKGIRLKNGETDDNTVLIETLWNVKSLKIISQAELSTSINRNIVECKDY